MDIAYQNGATTYFPISFEFHLLVVLYSTISEDNYLKGINVRNSGGEKSYVTWVGLTEGGSQIPLGCGLDIVAIGY